MSDRSDSGTHPLLAVLIAIVIACGAVGGYLWATWTGPVHQGQLLSMTTYPIHRELSSGDGLGGVRGAKDVYDEEIVVANVKIKSTTKLPLFLNDMSADVTLADGTVLRSFAASAEDYRKVFIVYPKLEPVKTHQVQRNITMTPGEVVEGQMIFNYPISQQQWDGRQNFQIHVHFLHQKDLILDQPKNGPTAGKS